MSMGMLRNIVGTCFQDGGDFFVMFTIRRNPDFNPTADDSNVGLKERESLIVKIIQENPHITAKELATRLHTTTRTAERIFHQLKSCEKIRREGGKRFGYWVVIK